MVHEGVGGERRSLAAVRREQALTNGGAELQRAVPSRRSRVARAVVLV